MGLFAFFPLPSNLSLFPVIKSRLLAPRNCANRFSTRHRVHVWV